jgi:nucleotide-binding universal stress UspA family protein
MTIEQTSTVAGPILVCLDGSPDSDAAAALALALARAFNKRVVAAHVYDARIHESRFRQMEPGLPEKYQAEEGLKHLRDSHGTLMTDGFQALSRGYMEGFLNMAREADIEVQTVVEEGRNYVGLLRIARHEEPSLTVLGAAGLGDTGDGMLGSTAIRLMRSLSCDLLIGRASSPAVGPVMAGIDGSEHALGALERAAAFAGALDSPLHLLAAYDPALHKRVFKAMADTMPPEAQAAVGLDKQQDLHESLIDDGLGTLYQTFLEEAVRTAGEGLQPVTHLVADKGYRGIVTMAGTVKARLICLGRFGHNREDGSDMGATAEAVVRLAPCHVHLSASPPAASASGAADEDTIPWEPEALARLERIPRFVRKMARRSIEAAAASEGAERVTVRHLEMVSERFRPKKY